MDNSIITAVAAIGGSLVGGVSSFATTYFTQTHQGRRDRIAREMEQREILYSKFIDHAAALFLDSADKSLDGPYGLIEIGAVMARIKLISTDSVIAATQTVLQSIIAAYDREPINQRDLVAQIRSSFTDPLAVFTNACRRERSDMLGRH